MTSVGHIVAAIAIIVMSSASYIATSATSATGAALDLRVAFYSDQPPGGVFSTNADGSKRVHLAMGGDPSWSPSGREVAYFQANEDGGTSSIHAVGADGSNDRLVIGGSGYSFRQPAWSPDGLRILATDSQVNARAIWVFGADGSNAERVTFGDAFDDSPAWSPDSKRFVFSRQLKRLGPVELFVGSVLTSTVAQLTFDSSVNTGATWSPDGSRILFASTRRSSDGPHTDIYSVAPDGTDERRFLETDFRPSESHLDPAWSPDGEYVAFSSRRGPSSEVFVVDATGRNPGSIGNTSWSDAVPSLSATSSRRGDGGNGHVDAPNSARGFGNEQDRSRAVIPQPITDGPESVSDVGAPASGSPDNQSDLLPRRMISKRESASWELWLALGLACVAMVGVTMGIARRQRVRRSVRHEAEAP